MITSKVRAKKEIPKGRGLKYICKIYVLSYCPTEGSRSALLRSYCPTGGQSFRTAPELLPNRWAVVAHQCFAMLECLSCNSLP